MAANVLLIALAAFAAMPGAPASATPIDDTHCRNLGANDQCQSTLKLKAPTSSTTSTGVWAPTSAGCSPLVDTDAVGEPGTARSLKRPSQPTGSAPEKSAALRYMLAAKCENSFLTFSPDPSTSATSPLLQRP